MIISKRKQTLNPYINYNSFTFLRLALAIGVIFSHTFPLYGSSEYSFFGLNLGTLCVHMFFALSGYLVTKSWVKVPQTLPFLVNRVFRLAPGLLLAILLSNSLSNVSTHYSHNPVPFIANGPIWTLPWEIACYLGLLFFGIIRTWTTQSIPIIYSLFIVLFVFNQGDIPSISTQVVGVMLLMFVGGGLVASLEQVIRWRWIGPLSAICLLLTVPPLKPTFLVAFRKIPLVYGPQISDERLITTVYILALPFFLIWIGAHIKFKLILKPDFSYGIYIYGWAVQQFVWAHFHRHLNHTTYFLSSLLITTIISSISWYLIESPILERKQSFTIFLKTLLK